jgi:hypothetical protein
LLAHSQELASDTQRSAFRIAQSLFELDEQIVEHPREGLDLVCVSDLVTISRATQAGLYLKDGFFLTVYSTLMSKAMVLGQD